MIEVPKEDEGEKGPEKISEEIIAWERKQSPKEEHAQTHNNQTDKI